MRAVAQTVPTVSLADDALRKKLLAAALELPEFRDRLNEAAKEIRDAAKPNVTEATIESQFEREVYAALRSIGLRFDPEKGVSDDVRRHTSRGRVDSRLGGLVIEYKRPSLLATDQQSKAALKQLEDYLTSLSAAWNAPMVGMLTNGLVVYEMRAVAGRIISTSSAEMLSGTTLQRLTRHVISLAMTALTSANLIRDFCGTDGVLFRAARVLNDILSAGGLPAKTEMLRSEWEQLFRLEHDDQSLMKKIEDRRAALATLFSIEINAAPAEYQALFALHTAYAIVLKFIAYRVVSDVYFGRVGQDFCDLVTGSDTYLQTFCQKLEDGEVFRDLGIINLLEGDFFYWYCDHRQWNKALADLVREIVTILARYEEAEKAFEVGEIPDLFRELYQAAVPGVVRSSLGEFYTPYWLAEHVIGSASPEGRWRAIDPCCGSGTFIIAAVDRIRAEHKNSQTLLHEIISRVVAIDLNPLAVLTTRIHYFIQISGLLADYDSDLVIPVYLGDAAAIPTREVVEGVECLRYELKTLQKPIGALLPVSLVEDTPKFMRLMVDYEKEIKRQDFNAARDKLQDAIANKDLVFTIRRNINSLTDQLVKMEACGKNGIWARILSNFLTTACVGQFSMIVGNPPWIDWKNLPEGYRNRLKAMCLERGLFSGAGRLGGINLNICAVIAYVSMSNWMEDTGRLSFLMPHELAIQASYEGWRRLGGRWKFLEFHDWSKAGHPFDPVKEDFMTYVIGRAAGRQRSVPTTRYEKRQRSFKASEWKRESEALSKLKESQSVAGQVIPGSTAFTFAHDQAELDEFALVAGECSYIGREGIQFYPQELHVFEYDGQGPRSGTVWVKNIRVEGAQHRIPQRRVPLETVYLRPLITAPTIEPFHVAYNGWLAPFPYEASTPKKPIAPSRLNDQSKLLLQFYENNKPIIDKQSARTKAIIEADAGAFYGLARTGPYRFGTNYVTFRKDSEWCAAVVATEPVPWDGEQPVVFQSHAVSMCERLDNEFISEDEAHYICAILNTSVVSRFINASSDQRSYKVRPPVYLPSYDPADSRHRRLAAISREAHADRSQIEPLSAESETLYLQLCRETWEERDEDAHDVAAAKQRLDELAELPGLLVTGEALRERLAELDT